MTRTVKIVAALTLAVLAALAGALSLSGPDAASQCRAALQSRVNAAVAHGLASFDASPYGPCTQLSKADFDRTADAVFAENVNRLYVRAMVDATR